MVQAIINIDDHTNRLLNIIKAKYDLKDKSQAIDKMAHLFEEKVIEPQLRPEFIKEMKKAAKEKKISIDDFGKYFGV